MQASCNQASLFIFIFSSSNLHSCFSLKLVMPCFSFLKSRSKQVTASQLWHSKGFFFRMGFLVSPGLEQRYSLISPPSFIRTEVFELFAGFKTFFCFFRVVLGQYVPFEVSTTFQALPTKIALKGFLFRMAFLVHPPITVTLKSPGTLFAFIRPNIGVNFLVRRKRTWPGKRLTAYITRIKLFFLRCIFSFLTNAMEVDLVFFHGLCMTKPFAAVRTLARLLSCVDSFVVSPIVKRYECLIAVLTDIGFFSSVNQLVFRQVMSLTKCLATLVTFVGSSVIVNVHVLAVLWSCGESFSAFCALARFLSFRFLGTCEISKEYQATIVQFAKCLLALDYCI